MEPRAPDPVGWPWRRRRTWALGAASVVLVAVGALAVARGRTSAGAAGSPGVPTVEEAILLRCLAPGDAAELVRPLLSDRWSRVVIAPEHAPRVLTVRTTPAQMRRVRAAIAEDERAVRPGCAVRPADPATP